MASSRLRAAVSCGQQRRTCPVMQPAANMYRLARFHRARPDIIAVMSASGPLARKTSVSSSSKSRAMANTTQEVTMTPPAVMRYFDPCAATAGMFLYAQGNSVVCCHHDTLTIERRFSRHDEEVQLLAVDTQSERGAGRLVVSYDAGSTAIVWDIMSGDEIARFSSYEHLTAAIWMKNGNVAFGNTQGNIILFEPETSEHISSRTLDQIAVTALAPAADCRTFAIGYQNGSLLICNLQPRFTILHNLTTSRGPSSIVNLAWHASSSRQKSDMLAVQTNDGDLRVWSVSKAYNNADPAKVVRILKRTENYLTGPNWMGWSKNGRIIQYSESETMSWDVRTKHVTFDSIPTLEHVRGLAVYGPGASLFTLGANNTVQQFDLNAPAVLVANAQHPANLLPPSPPVSIEEQDKAAAASNSESEISIGLEGVSESDDDHMSPIARMIQTKQHVDADQDFYGQPASEASSKSRKSSVSSASSRTPGRYQESIRSRGLTENTYISAGSSLRSPAASRYDSRNQDAHSISSLSSVSMGSSNHRSRHRPSRLRNEVPRSPEDSKVHDLFKFTKSRLHDLPYKHVPLPDSGKMTNEDLRRQMLSTIFGWNKDVEDLIRDEMSRHPNGSPNRVLLAKWLGDIESDIMTTSSQSMTSADWMRLALNGIGSQTSQQKLGRAFIQRLLEAGDIHAAVTMMLGMGDHNDAIEAYVSHKLYMEALLLCCLLFPAVWERQSQIVKKWGEWAAQHSQKQLAIRCFACSGKESSEPWTSPSAAQITFQSMTPSIPEVLSPPLSPPGIQRGPQRSIAKSSALKLITSFGDQNSRSKYFSGNEDGQTPIAAGVTPIAESAISPGAFADPATAFIRPGTRSALNTPSSARPSGPAAGFNRQRLPSIGEAPGDTPRGRLKASDLPTPPVDSLDKMSRGHASKRSHDETSFSTGMSIGRAATASPMMMREGPRVRKEHPPPSPSPASMAALMEGRTSRNGPRNRIPRGIEMHVDTIEALDQSDITSPEQSVASSTRFHWPSRRRGPGSVGGSSVTSGASSLARSHRGRHPGRSLDDYIHSLDAAKNKKRGNSREGGSAVRDSSRSRRGDSRERSADRGRTSSRAYTPKAGKRSPRSPVPMSPEDLINLSTPKLADLEAHGNLLIDVGAEEPSTVRKASTVRHVSSNRVGSRASSRGSRRRSPERRPHALDIPRGRGNSRESSAIRSPSSPLPMSSQALHYQGSEDEEDYRKAVEEQEKFRSRNNRSTSRNVREPSPGMGRSGRDRSQSRRGTKERDSPENRTRTPAITTPAAVSVGDLRQTKDIRTLKKEAAARELEERRKSLARRPLAPPIVHPDELSPAFFRTTDTMELPSSTFVPPKDLPVRSRTAEPGQTRSMYANRGPPIGLPATPKAMRLIMETDPNAVPGVPTIPATFAQRHSPTSPANNSSPDKSPKKEAAAPPSLTLLPSTVYSPPVRPPISRCMSAPPEEPVPPKALQGGGAPGAKTSSMQRRRSLRKLSTDTSVPTVRNIDGVMDTSRMARRQSRDDQIPPPPPPPPMLKELAHLATPPPPPPAPLPFGQKPAVYGGHASGTIEIVMEDGQTQPIPPPPPPVPVAIPVSEASVPIIAAPAPPSSRNGHHRGRSSIDNSIAGRISRATERMRSASRGRHNSSVVSRTKSPEGMPAPYESVPPPVSYRAPPELRSPIQPLPVNDFRTGLHQSEMI